MRIKNLFLGIMAFAVINMFLSAQDEGAAASLTLDFSASVISVNTDGDVDSFTDAGFGDDGESTLGFSYERESFGGTASLGFGPQAYGLINGDIAEDFMEKLFSVDELYAWVKPFGPNFKFTAGIFENTDGVADYTDDIDNFGMGVFMVGDGGASFEEPGTETDAALHNGFLSEAVFGPATVQLLLGPNFSTTSGSDFFGTYASYYTQGAITSLAADSRFFHMGGRIIADIGVGTVSALFKTTCWPMSVFDKQQELTLIAYNAAEGSTLSWTPYGGTAVNNMAFGVYADITAIENLALSVGYTGFTALSNDGNVDNVLWNGIDLRAGWTGIEGLSLSTHNNISFALGSDKEWVGFMKGDDSYFFSLYNAAGITKEITGRFSLNAEIGNIFVKTRSDRSQELLAVFGTPGDVDYDAFWGQVKFITSLAENAEFTAGIRAEGTKEGGNDLTAVFSVPVGITVSF
jgi:hypothetical protein